MTACPRLLKETKQLLNKQMLPYYLRHATARLRRQLYYYRSASELCSHYHPTAQKNRLLSASIASCPTDQVDDVIIELEGGGKMTLNGTGLEMSVQVH